MFSKEITNSKIPPNFLNSILTNKSLYGMFKDEYEENKDYFQNIPKEEYLDAMLSKIEELLFKEDKLEIYEIEAIKVFFDDFLYTKFNEDKLNLLKTKLFKGLNTHLSKNYSKEYKQLYEYIFEKTNYSNEVDNIIKPILNKFEEKEGLNINEYNILTNYIKNYIKDYIDMDVVYELLRLHAYKTNHIFDKEVVNIILKSITREYTDFNIRISSTIEKTDVKSNTIYIDPKFIDDFIFGNYVELINELFINIEMVQDYNYLKDNKLDYNTLKCIENMIIYKVDLDRVYEDESYNPYQYFNDMKASCFVKTMRFFSSFGVNLYNSYINNKSNKIVIKETGNAISHKSIPLDIRFLKAINKNNVKYISEYYVLSSILNMDGTRIKTIDLIKKMNGENQEFIIEYLNKRIIEPESIIDDVNELISYKTTKESNLEIIDKLIRYIYVDTFNYSLNGYIKLYKMEKEEYLNDLLFKVKCIKNIPQTHKFIDEAIYEIETMKQNI